MQRPLISCTQKIVVYETKAKFYVVGSNNTETKFRVFKIDRMEPQDLHIIDDKVEYSRKEIRELLRMIDVGNRSRWSQKGASGLKRTVSAFGIVGFVRFLEGYYMVLITKRRRVALIGCHAVFKIEDTCMVYIPNDLVRSAHPDEPRYVKMFQNVDLSSNFYFSYSYDVTHTLQFNMAACNLPTVMTTSTVNADESSSAKFWQTDTDDDRVVDDSSSCAERDVEDASCVLQADLFYDDNHAAHAAAACIDTVDSGDQTVVLKHMRLPQHSSATDGGSVFYGVRTAPYWKYVWNEYLLKRVCCDLHSDWLLYIIHGFIGQSNISVFGRSIYLTLVSRRSNQFAGTRFLKRGGNSSGAVANEVETEQIVYNASLTLYHKARFTSFVQHRGSIPLYWSQDINKMVPKPPISLDQADPYGQVAGQHFNELIRRFGSPIIVLDLVKKYEKKKHESIISEEFVVLLQYLNQFLPTEHAIRYIGFDMARVSKIKSSNVLHRLAKIAEYCVRKTGFFQSQPPYYCRRLRPNSRHSAVICGQRQHGVVRTNCVDCLDRTNTAQFAIGKTALGMQLHALGIIDSPQLEFETDCVRMMEDLYEDQGDTLALQYGGSQLVHRIKGYRKVAPWTSSSRDIMQTLSRYYSNAFSDSDKQNAINLFLGMFEPTDGQPNIWELTTDFYLHNRPSLGADLGRSRRYTQWWDLCAIRYLPYSCDDVMKGTEEEEDVSHQQQQHEQRLMMIVKTDDHDERINGFWEHYRPYELTVLGDQYSFNMPNSVRDFMPKYANNVSAFTLRVAPGRRQEEYGSSAAEANPNVSGKDSTSSTTSTGSEGSTSDSGGSEIEGNLDSSDNDRSPTLSDRASGLISLKDLFSTMKQTYGVEIVEPDESNVAMYSRFVKLGVDAMELPVKQTTMNRSNLLDSSIVYTDSSFSVEPPRVSSRSMNIYQQYVSRGLHGAGPPTEHDLDVYRQYVLSSQ